jgi:DeoR family transcriptional regulator of aga operon
MDLNPDEVRLKREMAEACQRVVGLFDRTKWNRTALLSFVATGRVDAIVTDNGAPADLVQSWRDHGVDVVLAEVQRVGSAERPPALRRDAAGGAA